MDRTGKNYTGEIRDNFRVTIFLVGKCLFWALWVGQSMLSGLWYCKPSGEKFIAPSLAVPWVCSLFVCLVGFYPALVSIFSMTLNFDSLITICFGIMLLNGICWKPQHSCTWLFMSFHRIRQFFAFIYLNENFSTLSMSEFQWLNVFSSWKLSYKSVNILFPILSHTSITCFPTTFAKDYKFFLFFDHAYFGFILLNF